MSLIYFEDMIHYYYTPTLEDIMKLEVGDMILWAEDADHETDIGGFWLGGCTRNRQRPQDREPENPNLY